MCAIRVSYYVSKHSMNVPSVEIRPSGRLTASSDYFYFFIYTSLALDGELWAWSTLTPALRLLGLGLTRDLLYRCLGRRYPNVQ